ncbi:MAG: N-formylglutamate amidohydrolase, partial [Betaproteobacteria bacterium]|nr:N-formylglutamate amidohydrolase [Betaproteobacteria bacterium]
AFDLLSHQPGFSAVHNGRFKGGYITRHYGQPAQHIHALQLETGQDCYLQGTAFDAARAAPLMALFLQLFRRLLAWRPSDSRDS